MNKKLFKIEKNLVADKVKFINFKKKEVLQRII
jgi:hypothetical protein